MHYTYTYIYEMNDRFNILILLCSQLLYRYNVIYYTVRGPMRSYQHLSLFAYGQACYGQLDQMVTIVCDGLLLIMIKANALCEKVCVILFLCTDGTFVCFVTLTFRCVQRVCSMLSLIKSLWMEHMERYIYMYVGHIPIYGVCVIFSWEGIQEVSYYRPQLPTIKKKQLYLTC